MIAVGSQKTRLPSFAALLLCEREKIRRGGPVILRGRPPHLPPRTGSRISAGQVWGDSARLGFQLVTSIHFGCRPLFGARLRGEVIA